MEEVLQNLRQAQADVTEGLTAVELFSNPARTKKELGIALHAINRAIADLEEQLNK